MTDKSDTRIRSAELTGNRRRHFDLRPDGPARKAIAQDLGMISLGALRFWGELRPSGRSDVELVAELEADGVQPCVVTLAPVPAKIAVQVRRQYIAGMETPEGDEVEMPEDDTQEPLPEVIDLESVMIEALALALPDYPRAKGAELGEALYAEPGIKPISDEDLKPFAGLAALKAKLEK